MTYWGWILLVDDPSLAWRIVASAALGSVLTLVGLAIATFSRDVVTSIVSVVQRGRHGN